eukprot:CAMPEP_0117822264 /NCGR_PEP_ID=MMETSP0949-20121206/3578_1 /TAXON_ID=44440 /ORGANISM="Chattonella subsalsa, Strain CCMP2191" /LENGTH=141 /DNA_ID=CAMNT_0005661613 /DNA_START=77 /DNA_END=499 /DNA_ORIENTATION=+
MNFSAVLALFVCSLGLAAAFNTPMMKADGVSSRRNFLKEAAGVGAVVFGAASPALANIDYEGVKYLGGGDKVDLNNANIRAYLRLPGLYPTIAGKIVSNGPYKTVGDVYSIKTLSDKEKDVLKKYESKFVVLDPKPEYVID